MQLIVGFVLFFKPQLRKRKITRQRHRRKYSIYGDITFDLLDQVSEHPHWRMGSTGNDRFNEEAATWDSDPTVNKASEEAFKAIVDTFPQLRQNGGQ